MDKTAEFNLITYLTEKRDSAVIVWLCNLGAEKYWHAQSTGIIDTYEESIVNRIEEMNLLLCREQDILILHRRPEQEYLNYLRDIGFSIPVIYTPSDTNPLTPIAEKVLKDETLQNKLLRIARERKEVYFVPYAVTSLEEQIAERCGLRLVGAPSRVGAAVNDKIFSREAAEMLGLPVCTGNICTSMEEIRAAYSRLVHESPFFRKVIIKEPYGASGKGLYLVEDENTLQGLLARLSRLYKKRTDGVWLVEGWLEKAVDVNYQIFITEDGHIEVFSIKQQILNGTVYLGSKIPAAVERNILQAYETFGLKIGEYLYNRGYRGIASIDSIITQDGTIIPIIEINGRFTLSTYISFLNPIPANLCIQTRYFKLVTRRPVGYGELLAALEKKGILYRKGSGSGVIIYTAGTLPEQPIANDNLYLGRLFAMMIAEDRTYVETLEIEMSDLVSGLAQEKVEKPR